MISTVTTGQTTGLEEDNTDLWSKRNRTFPYVEGNPREVDLAPENFEIAHIVLRTAEFDDIAAKLGKFQIVNRSAGDYARHQACYVSRTGSPTVHLIYEFGEDESAFYIFTGMPKWNGSNLCLESSHVSMDLSTPSGLRLGLASADVEKILGKPDRKVANRLIYDRFVKRKTTPAEFERMRREYPGNLSDQQAHREFDFYEVGLYIEARFSNSKLNYLVVSTAGAATD